MPSTSPWAQACGTWPTGFAALGARLEVRAVPTYGTTVTGQLPTVLSPAPMIGP
jgi:hypothetical protein